MGTPSYTLMLNCTSSGSGGYTSPCTGGETPVLLAPSYQQARQPEVMKQSPPRAATPNLSMESPKTIHSDSKDSPHHSSERSSNTSTPKHPDSTSAKKPSSSKEPTSNGKEKSPKACSSYKHGHSLGSWQFQAVVNYV